MITRPMLTFFILGDILGAGIYSLTGIVGASIIYLLVGFTAAMTVPLDTLTESSGPLLEVVKEGVPGLNADTVFSAVAMTAVSNTMLINMLMASRLLYGMANPGSCRPRSAWCRRARRPGSGSPSPPPFRSC